MTSLRRRLLLSLWIAVTSVAIVSATIAYLGVSANAKELLDAQLVQIAGLVSAQRSGAPGTRGPSETDVEIAIWDANGTLKYASTPPMAAQHDSKPEFSEVLLGQEPYRLYTATIHGDRIAVAQPVDVRDDQAEAAALAALLPALLLLPVLGIVIGLVIRTLLKPVRAIAAQVSQRAAFATEPLRADGLPKEIAPLVEELNRLLARQNEAAARERHFVEDAAHALRTPLAALQLQSDVLDGSPDPVERAARLADLKAGIQRTSRLSDQLLSLARAESATGDDVHGIVHVDEVFREAHAAYAANEPPAAVDLEAHSHATVRGDSRALLLIFRNLVDNALRYSEPGGRAAVRVDSDGDWVVIEVWDEGPGLPEAELPKVFERFYQVAGDSRAGSGLGLATVQALASRLGGRALLRNRSDRQGLIARVELPRTDAATPAPGAGR